MTSYFERLVDFVGAHPQLSFLAVFLLALSEAVPVIGTVVPGSTLIFAISALATTAGIMPWALLVAAVLGAIAGDGFSFWLLVGQHAASRARHAGPAHGILRGRRSRARGRRTGSGPRLEHDLPRIDSYRRDPLACWLSNLAAAKTACDAIGTRPIYTAVAAREGAQCYALCVGAPTPHSFR